MAHWKVAWEYRSMDYSAFPIHARNEIQRLYIRNNLKGTALRVRFSNLYGNKSLYIQQAAVQIPGQKEIYLLKEKGKEAFEISAGEILYTDRLPVELTGEETLCIHVKVPQQEVMSACSFFPQGISEVSIEDPDKDIVRKQAATGLLRLEPEHCCFYGCDRIEVETGERVSTIVCFGDSITHRSLWTAPFAEKVYGLFPHRTSVLNYGISGNRMLHNESPYTDYGKWFGRKGIERLSKELDTVPDLSAVVVLHGINDIYHVLYQVAPEEERVTAEQLIEGLESYAEIIRSHKAVSCAGTILPFNNAGGSWSEQGEQVRTEVNKWIRETKAFDMVVDFDAAVADAEDPTRMSQACDSGDNLHPGPQGGLQMAACFNEKMITKMIKE